MSEFTRAVKYQEPVKMAIIGPSNSGKTFTALRVGLAMANAIGSRLAFIDTEHGSAKKYADAFDFDVLELTDFKPPNYIEAIQLAEKSGYKVLVIDSISHAWAGKGGVLELVDRAKARDSRGFNAWREVTPLHNAFVEAMLSTKMHLIVTMRSKMEYAQEKDEQTGKVVVRKLGLQPVQRDGVEYEFDIIGDMDQQHNFSVSKTRCTSIDGEVFARPGEDLANILLRWSGTGEAGKSAAPEPADPLPDTVAKPKRGRPKKAANTVEAKAAVDAGQAAQQARSKEDEEKFSAFLHAVDNTVDNAVDALNHLTEVDPGDLVLQVVDKVLEENGIDVPWLDGGADKVSPSQRMPIFLRIQKELKSLVLENSNGESK